MCSTVFIAAGGYAINDYFDRKIDRVNKPNAVIVGRFIYPRHAMAWHLIFSISGVILGTWLAWKSGQLYLSLVFFIVSGLLWFYSTTYKREVLLGNVIVSLLAAFVPFLVLLFELPLLAREYGQRIVPITRNLMIWVLGFSVLAFLINLAREIIKDAADFEGDQAYGKRTIPVVWGVPYARWFAASCVAAAMILLAVAWLFFVRDVYTLAYFSALLVLPLGIVLYLLWPGKGHTSWGLISTVLKIVMLAGMGYMVVANLIINYVL
jgi:4-hydroxybenzoate polyprenyltransferase